MKQQTTINWNQAEQISQHETAKQKQDKIEAMEDIKTSDFSMLDATDIQFYANILDITCNEVREINIKHTGANAYDIMNSFENDETDDIIDFY